MGDSSFGGRLSGLAATLGLGVDRRPQVQRDVWVLGTEYGAHAVCGQGIDETSVMYSVGLGEDISFDLALIERTGLIVHGFDPTPRSLAWLETQDLPESFHVHAEGLAHYDGTATFSPPVEPTHISHTLLDRPETSERSIEVEVRRLSSLMASLGHQRLDILKLDIEGAEYEVIDEILQSGIEVNQLLLEFHHQFKSIPVARTLKTIRSLNEHGYQTFHVAPNGRELSFVRVQS
ncbi:MAG: FkbM family methyltransferase [Myxococcota bacterium]|nr:FkbM family methyltransferase [Myxococcota bacterium]